MSRPSKANVARAAARIGATFEVDRDSVFIAAPKGHRWADDTYGFHYSEWPTDYCTKAEAYECCLEMLADGVEPCDCDDCARES